MKTGDYITASAVFLMIVTTVVYNVQHFTGRNLTTFLGNRRRLATFFADPKTIQQKERVGVSSFPEECRPEDITMLKLCDYEWEMTGPEKHYDGEYFEWQKQYGIDIGPVYAKYWSERFDLTNKVVADVGCGGGYALREINQASVRYCFEINPTAIRAHDDNLVSIDKWSLMPDDHVDYMFSHHSFEHHPSPLLSLQCAITKLKPGSGIMHLEVPYEHAGCGQIGKTKNHYGRFYHLPNLSFHLYTWSPRLLGQLMHAAGFVDIECIDIRGIRPELYIEHKAHTFSVWCIGRRS